MVKETALVIKNQGEDRKAFRPAGAARGIILCSTNTFICVTAILENPLSIKARLCA